VAKRGKYEEFRPKLKVQWRPATGGPSLLWRKLWPRLLINKERVPQKQNPDEDASKGGRKQNEH